MLEFADYGTEVDMKQLSEIFSANVRRLRAQRGWSRTELAHLLGSHRTLVNALESAGKRDFNLATVQKVADCFGVTPLSLLTEHNDEIVILK